MRKMLQTYKAMHHADYDVDYATQKGGGRAAQLYGQKLCREGFTLEVALRLFEASTYSNDMEGFMTGFNGFKPATHFVGFRGEEFWSAVKVWGRPDFFHRHWDARVPGDVAPGDTVVFAKGTDQDPFVKFTFDDSAVFADENKFG